MSETPLHTGEHGRQIDLDLVEQSLKGSKKSLEMLIKRHQNLVYNIVWKMVLNPQDAEDLSQEILVKAITKLSQFDGRSLFTTWLYRIAVNHVLNCRMQRRELLLTSFSAASDLLESLPDHEYPESEYARLANTVEDVRISCTAGMLLCLDRAQRIVFILGGIFQIDHRLGAEILEISPDNFRQQLSRARKDLYSFMERKCGLVNKSNPCRCPKKTRAFIESGWATPHNLQFNARHIRATLSTVPHKNSELLTILEEKYEKIFSSHPLQEPLTADKIVDQILNDGTIRRIFNLG